MKTHVSSLLWVLEAKTCRLVVTYEQPYWAATPANPSQGHCHKMSVSGVIVVVIHDGPARGENYYNPISGLKLPDPKKD